MIRSKVKTMQGDEPITAYTADETILTSVKFEPWNNNRRVYYYAADYAVLDTETSHDSITRGWVYQWAVKWQGQYIYGRKPSELVKLLKQFIEFYNLGGNRRLIFYIHNASYDMQYLKRYFMSLGNMHVMATDAHTFLIVDIEGIRFLCSYKLSNMSLDLFSKSYAEKYVKASGEIDYTLVRYQDEHLTPEDWYYMFSDVASQYDAIHEYLKINGYDRAYKAPYTSTGFVRSNCRSASAHSLNWHKKFLTSALTLEQYQLCRQAFMGGITICSWQYEGDTVRVGRNGVQKIGHKDFVSSYPARQMLDYFPIGKGFWWGEVKDEKEFDTLLDTYCCVFLLYLEKVRIKEGITAPYIPSSKCISLINPLKINGKVIYADSLIIAVTEIDYKWIKRQYKAEGQKPLNMLCFNRGKAPVWLRNEVMQYFVKKCTTAKNTKDYSLVKALLNSIYGMSATQICRDNWRFGKEGEKVNGVDVTGMIIKDGADSQNQIDRFYGSRNNFMPYQIGVYTTAHARNALMTMIETIGYDNFLYCDTDSAFYISTPEIEARLDKMNEGIIKRAKAAGAYYENKFLGAAEDEPDIRAFRGLHAKCYAMEEYNKRKGDYELKVTIAGIPKVSTKWIDGKPVTKTNAEELKHIDRLQDGFVFKHCGGTRTAYIEDDPHTEVINGHPTELSSAAIIDNIEKEISNTMWTNGADYSIMHINAETIL